MVSVGDDDSGQLILVGSVALAFIVVTLAIAFNGALFTDSLTDSGARGDLAAAEQFDRQAARDVPTLLLYVNHREPYASTSELDAVVRANVSTYARLQAESRVHSGPSVVDVSLGDRTNGTRVVQASDGPFTRDGSTGGVENWDPVNESRSVGWAVLNLDARNVSDATGSDRFHVVLDDDDGNTATLYVSRNTTTGQDSETIDVETVLSSRNGTARRACTSSRGRLLVDLRDGTTFGGSCSFNLTEPLDGPYTVEFENGDRATGKYAFVVAGDPPNARQGGTYGCPVGTGACNAPVVWEATVTTTYETGRTTTRNNHTVEVYP